MKAKITLMAVMLLLVTRVTAQTAAELIRQANKSYESAGALSMDVRYSLYANYSTAVAHETSNGTFIKQGSFYCSSLLGITTLQNKKYKLSVSDSERMIIVGDPVKVDQSPGLSEVDTLLKQCSSTEVKQLEDGVRNCILHFEGVPFSEFDRIEVEIGKNGFVTRMVLFYREAISLDETNPDLKKEKPRLEIAYSNINTAPQISPDQFSEKKYIIDNRGEITGAPAYSNYRILNHKK